MRFYDQHLKGQAPAVQDPPFAIQTNDGAWRSEAQWPPADAQTYSTPLSEGTYVDHAQSVATGWDATSSFTTETGTAPSDPTVQSGVWTVSSPLPHDVHLSGSPTASVDVTTTLPDANLVVDVYQLSEDGNGDWTGPLVTRQGHLVRDPGDSTIPLTLWGADWKFEAGERIAVRVTDNNQDWFLMARPSLQPVTVRGGSIDLPFLGTPRTETIAGDPGVQLAPYLETHIATAPADAVAAATDFALPPAQSGGPGDPPPPSANGTADTGKAPSSGTGKRCKKGKKLKRGRCVKKKRKKRR
jgi:hypothetical protein